MHASASKSRLLLSTSFLVFLPWCILLVSLEEARLGISERTEQNDTAQDKDRSRGACEALCGMVVWGWSRGRGVKGRKRSGAVDEEQVVLVNKTKEEESKSRSKVRGQQVTA